MTPLPCVQQVLEPLPHRTAAEQAEPYREWTPSLPGIRVQAEQGMGLHDI